MSKIVDLLIDAYDQGCTHDELTKMIVGTLTPYFRNQDKVRKYWSSSELLTAFEFLIRYYHDKAFSRSVLEVLDIYRKAFAADKKQTDAVVHATPFDFSQRESIMWSMQKEEDASPENDANEKITGYIKHIGETLEIGTKHLIYELWALLKIAGGAAPEYPRIRNLEFGAVVQNILDQQKLYSILVTDPVPVSLSDWRNISYHQTYRILDDSKIFFIYGRKHLSFTLTFDELKQYTSQIVKSANILSIARCIFVFDYVVDLSADGFKKSPRQTALRDSMLKNRLRISFLSQGFYLDDVTETTNSITALVKDLTNGGSLPKETLKERYKQSSRFLYDIWCDYQKEKVVVKYVNSLDTIEFSSSVDGDTCRKVKLGEEDLAYLVRHVNIDFISETI